MVRYLCWNPECVYPSHTIPTCPNLPPAPLPYVPVDRSGTYRHLRKLHEAGVISDPRPRSTFRVMSPFLLVLLLPLALFVFFVLVLLLGH
ncbi:hypothetical protein [Nocardia sp. NBC_01388]|uniref:hypothetical protein n=1 Tax=Nocardia sp. NBC_01388 TaxID=2903596 RepID=UPI002F90B476